jgi:hypothetical protein
MNHYAKFTGPHPKKRRFFVEIWKTTQIDNIEYEEIVDSKFCWTFWGAYKWAQKSIIRYTMYEKFQTLFLKEENIIRKEH